jgi:serine phosphatase RsbU (regulator of sigma subunit)/CHASE3 domain sensor protein/anti-sigma regulatory factor (Ser/Thr protein kinase)
MNAVQKKARGLGIRLQVLLLVAGPLVFLLVVSAMAWLVLQRTDAATALSKHSADILTQSDNIFRTVNQANSSLAEYTRTHQEATLAAYRETAATIPNEVSRLRALVDDDPATKPTADAYEKVVLQILPIWSEFADDVRTRDMKKAAALDAAPSTRALANAWQNAKMNFDGGLRLQVIARLNALRASLHNLEIILVTIAIIGVLFTLFIALEFGWSIVSRLRRLAQNAELLSVGSATQPIGGTDEIAKLDRAYHDITQRMMQTLEDRERALEAYEREHVVAITLQRALLPESLPDIPGLRIDGAYVPATADADIGGDWYDVFELPDHRVGLSVGDVAGHGLRAAVLMGNVRQTIRGAAHFETTPSSVLKSVNQQLCSSEDALVTAFFGILDLNDGTLHYSIAGHPAPIVVQPNGDVETLAGHGLLLGFDRGTPFNDFEARLDVGSGLVLYTDGVVEIERDYLKGMRDLEDAVLAESFDPSSNIAQGIQQRVMGELKTRDDAALLFIGITTLASVATSEHRWTFDAYDEAAARRMKRAVLWQFAGLASNTPEFGAIEAILGELLSNVARHSPGAASVTLEHRKGELILHVDDNGKPFDLNGRAEPHLYAESGRGLLIVQAFARDVNVERRENGNRVSAVLPLPTQP